MESNSKIVNLLYDKKKSRIGIKSPGSPIQGCCSCWTGSNNFLLQENISQSLAGRIGYLNLLPLSVEEIADNSIKSDTLMFKGGYPAISLLGFDSDKYLNLNPFRGQLFENLVVVEFLKRRFNEGKSNNLFFWRDNVGNEVDLLLVNGSKITPVEIKSGQTITNDYFKGIQYWNKVSQTQGGYLIYGGDSKQSRGNGITVLPYNLISEV